MNAVTLAKNEFLLDEASYFADKKELYLEIKSRIAKRLALDVAEVRICGSAYWGRRFVNDQPFQPGVSDLDVALVNSSLFCRCMTEVREKTRNFSDQTSFPASKQRVSAFEIFRDYAFGKGLIQMHHLPEIQTGKDLQSASEIISKDFLDHFEKISFAIYDSSNSFAVKQARAAEKFRG